MKLFSTFIKELKLASRGFYFYIEIFVTILILTVFLFLIPDNFDSKSSEYLYLDMPTEASDAYLEALSDESIDSKAKQVKVKIDKKEKDASLYTLDDKEVYLLNSKEDVIHMADIEREMGAVVSMDENYEFNYEYYLQGYESNKFKDLLKILHVESSDTIEMATNNQDVRPLATDYEFLSDRDNMLATVLVFNGSLMGLLIIAAYIFLDKQEGVIKAYALTPSPVWQYLLSKIGVVTVMSLISSFLIVIPIMGSKPDYLLFLVLLLTTGFFSSSLGLLTASFFENIVQSFGAILTYLFLMIIPNIAYFMPSWSPNWIKIIPTYPMLEGFKSILLGNGDWAYILTISSGFLIAGIILFALSNYRYKKTLVEAG